ncbi:beta-1,4-galactosyltransferase 4-like [Physella acuta]|uniref:beta-1,4-galactosyltransferase 4-like n=1 Tax=Physella acuta TaxID=109671 RepID=UPI0027DEA1A8|nr:beta-1,4-galactosyltransferase 4-like [Physella acuta]
MCITRSRSRLLLGVVCVLALFLNGGYIVWHSRAYRRLLLQEQGRGREHFLISSREFSCVGSSSACRQGSRTNTNTVTMGDSHQQALTATERQRGTIKVNATTIDMNSREGTQENEFNSTSETSQDQLCPLYSSTLQGEIKCTCDGKTTLEDLTKLFPFVQPGGRVQPTGCQARERVAIIVPYRDRYPHLLIFIHMMIPVLQRQHVDATLFIIEQLSPLFFNRGALHNIGYLEALKLDAFDCFIFHDVDMVPANDKLLYTCADSPKHFSAMVKYMGLGQKMRKMYDANFGGVVGFKTAQYKQVNGNSNLYFGWGGEDDDMYQRILHVKMNRVRPPVELAQYQMLSHERQNLVNGNPKRTVLLKNARTRQAIDGLNSVSYKVISNVKDTLFTWIKVDINMDDIFQNAPIHLHTAIRVMSDLERKRQQELKQKAGSKQPAVPPEQPKQPAVKPDPPRQPETTADKQTDTFLDVKKNIKKSLEEYTKKDSEKHRNQNNIEKIPGRNLEINSNQEPDQALEQNNQTGGNIENSVT